MQQHSSGLVVWHGGWGNHIILLTIGLKNAKKLIYSDRMLIEQLKNMFLKKGLRQSIFCMICSSASTLPSNKSHVFYSFINAVCWNVQPQNSAGTLLGS